MTRGPSCKACEPRVRALDFLNDGNQLEDLDDRLSFFRLDVFYGEETEADRLP